MKISIVNSVYQMGSTGNMAKTLTDFFEGQGHDVCAFYGRKGNSSDRRTIKVDSAFEVGFHMAASLLTGLQGHYSKKATAKLIGKLGEFSPDIVILLNVHGYYLNENSLFEYLGDADIPVLNIMPDEYPFLGKCCFSFDCTKYETKCFSCPQTRMYPLSLFLDRSTKIFEEKRVRYSRCKRLAFAGPQYSLEKARRSALLSDQKLYCLDWGIDVEDQYKPISMKQARQALGLPLDQRIFLTIGSFSDRRKGIKEYYYPCAQALNDMDALFVHVGYTEKKTGLPENYLALPYISNQDELVKYYCAADCVVLPSLQDTMPYAALIALACGVPICCFNTSGMAYLADQTCCYYVEEISVAALQEQLALIPARDTEKSKVCRNYAERRYSSYRFCSTVEDICRDILER